MPTPPAPTGSSRRRALARAAVAAGVTTLAVTDHDTLAGVRELVAAPAGAPDGIPAGLTLIPGVEINTVGRGRGLPDGELHVVGLGVDPADDAFEAVLARQRGSRRLRFSKMTTKLRETGYPIDAYLEAVDLARDDALGRPTLARALVAAGFAVDVQDAFVRLVGYGGPGYVPREGIGPLEAIAAIRAAGGLAVLAHFAVVDQQEALLRELIGAGLDGIETQPSELRRPDDPARRDRRRRASSSSRRAGPTSTATNARTRRRSARRSSRQPSSKGSLRPCRATDVAAEEPG